MEYFKIKYKKLNELAITPCRGTEYSAGYDLYSPSKEDITIEPGCKVLIKTDITMEIPVGYYGRVAPRSSLAHKHFIDVGAGVIDSDYRGNIGVILFNFGKTSYTVKYGDRIAQLIITRIICPELEEVNELNELKTTERGDGGFGSTGK